MAKPVLGLEQAVSLVGRMKAAAEGNGRIVAVNLHDKDVHVVPMRFERAAPREGQIGARRGADSHLSLDGRAKLTDLWNPVLNVVHNDAYALRQQIVKSADMELLSFVRRV